MKKYIDFNGNQVLDATPDYKCPQLALVDMRVLRMLTDMLPVTDFSSIRHNLRLQIMNTDSLEHLVDVCDDFIAFQKSVNLITELMSSDVTQATQAETVEPESSKPRRDLDIPYGCD